MQTARLAITGAQIQLLPALKETAALPNSSSRMRNRVTQNEPLPTMDDIVGLAARTDPGPSTGMQGDETNMNGEF